jgi:hypothetical protein
MKIKPFRKITESSFIKDNYLIIHNNTTNKIFINHVIPIRGNSKASFIIDDQKFEPSQEIAAQATEWLREKQKIKRIKIVKKII